MSYQIITDIEKPDMMIYIGIIIAISWFTNRVKPSWHVVAGVIVGIVVTSILYQQSDHEDTVFTKRMTRLLDSKLYAPYRHLYLNSELVMFLDTHREYYQYNPSAYKTMMQHIDNFLRLGKEIETGTQLHNEDYSTMRHLKGKILNYYQAIIHRLPHTPNSLDKFNHGMEELRGHINKYLDSIHQIVNQKNMKEGINVETAFVYRSHPKPTDPTGDARWNFFQYEV